MMAGRMRLRMFLVLAFASAGLAGFGLYQACGKDRDGGDPVATAPARDTTDVRPAPVIPSAPTPTPGGSAPVANPIGESGADLPARAYDREVIAWRDQKISGDKLKDASKGRSWKVNVYQDVGMRKVNRAKVDLDRDDKWDEKFTFEDRKVTLQRAPADDEQYTETYHWTGDGWATAR